MDDLIRCNNTCVLRTSQKRFTSASWPQRAPLRWKYFWCSQLVPVEDLCKMEQRWSVDSELLSLASLMNWILNHSSSGLNGSSTRMAGWILLSETPPILSSALEDRHGQGISVYLVCVLIKLMPCADISRKVCRYIHIDNFWCNKSQGRLWKSCSALYWIQIWFVS